MFLFKPHNNYLDIQKSLLSKQYHLYIVVQVFKQNILTYFSIYCSINFYSQKRYKQLHTRLLSCQHHINSCHKTNYCYIQSKRIDYYLNLTYNHLNIQCMYFSYC
ncbi:transmembrane protein, putative (macronuclear) [Tetrahymena thermophila SB210]|uniref:Transmembrane protein, putative n=1 Tax=Tetrahymena thermophila (strain SB210) TaxID=312017 RepID=W7XLA1_TETTS|nr:transmembrane protein, putative [Tetrahymena thermophila SB210]EWS75929.1 transmembrane protein, putative [Tetrahymena thermophila SB210]|eukprot:XP_012651538.1 transmembrane protein, putative [Tetrahymena thermophila SB210]